jgi:hypothetical protein
VRLVLAVYLAVALAFAGARIVLTARGVRDPGASLVFAALWPVPLFMVIIAVAELVIRLARGPSQGGRPRS